MSGPVYVTGEYPCGHHEARLRMNGPMARGAEVRKRCWNKGCKQAWWVHVTDGKIVWVPEEPRVKSERPARKRKKVA